MDLGLRSDRSFVLDVATDPSAGRADYGYPLLPEEVAYLERREVARAQLDATQDYLSGLSRTVAGLYLDNQAPRAAGIDLTLVVAFTDNAESHRAELTRLLPKGVALALKTAKYSKAELDSIVEDVIADREWHKSLGIDVYVAGTDERRDRVLLGISEPNESAAAALASRYGADRIYVYVSAKPELDACIRTNCPPPWVAGLKIDSTSNPATGNHCTSGFSVKSASGNWFQLTAGHCPRWNR